MEQDAPVGHTARAIEQLTATGEVAWLEPSFKERVRAAELILKTRGELTAKQEISGPDGGAIPLEDVAKRLFGVEVRPAAEGESEER